MKINNHSERIDKYTLNRFNGKNKRQSATLAGYSMSTALNARANIESTDLYLNSVRDLAKEAKLMNTHLFADLKIRIKNGELSAMDTKEYLTAFDTITRILERITPKEKEKPDNKFTIYNMQPTTQPQNSPIEPQNAIETELTAERIETSTDTVNTV